MAQFVWCINRSASRIHHTQAWYHYISNAISMVSFTVCQIIHTLMILLVPLCSRKTRALWWPVAKLLDLYFSEKSRGSVMRPTQFRDLPISTKDKAEDSERGLRAVEEPDSITLHSIWQLWGLDCDYLPLDVSSLSIFGQPMMLFLHLWLMPLHLWCSTSTYVQSKDMANRKVDYEGIQYALFVTDRHNRYTLPRPINLIKLWTTSLTR